MLAGRSMYINPFLHSDYTTVLSPILRPRQGLKTTVQMTPVGRDVPCETVNVLYLLVSLHTHTSFE